MQKESPQSIIFRMQFKTRVLVSIIMLLEFRKHIQVNGDNVLCLYWQFNSYVKMYLFHIVTCTVNFLLMDAPNNGHVPSNGHCLTYWQVKSL